MSRRHFPSTRRADNFVAGGVIDSGDRWRLVRCVWVCALSALPLSGCALFGSIDAADYRVSSGDGSGAAGGAGAGGGSGGSGVGGTGTGLCAVQTTVAFIEDDTDDAEFHREMFMGFDESECIDGCGWMQPGLVLSDESQLGFRFRLGLGIPADALIEKATLRFEAALPVPMPGDTLTVSAWEPGIDAFDDAHGHEPPDHGALLPTEVVQAPTDSEVIVIAVDDLIPPLLAHREYTPTTPVAFLVSVGSSSSFGSGPDLGLPRHDDGARGDDTLPVS